MHFGRRVCALTVVLAMLAALPLAAPRGCPDCPVGCPMHARGEQRLGCHRAPPAPSGEVCLRGSCGRDMLARAERAPDAVIRPAARVDPIVRTRDVVTEDVAIASLPLPEPPTEPPRSVRV
jgi:hypothetical protein